MTRIGVFHADFRWGGSEAVAVRAASALDKDYVVDLITLCPVSAEEIDESYGTTLGKSDVRIRCPLGSRILSAKSDGFWAFRQAVGMRYTQFIEKDYDLLFGADNEFVSSLPSLQYIHYPAHASHLLGQSTDNSQEESSWFKKLYRRLSYSISPLTNGRVEGNRTLTNSKWTKDLIRELYGIESTVIYPPVPGVPKGLPWSEREAGFLCLGRISPQKEILKVIEIIRSVRERGFPVHLHIVGSEDYGSYVERVKEAANRHDWVHYEGFVKRGTYNRLLAEHKFGIHGMPGEHFGISVAEMRESGCIVFAPDSGGQAEIVDSTKALYKNPSEAVEKICRVLESSELQADLLDSDVGPDFSPERFEREIRKEVSELIGD